MKKESNERVRVRVRVRGDGERERASSERVERDVKWIHCLQYLHSLGDDCWVQLRVSEWWSLFTLPNPTNMPCPSTHGPHLFLAWLGLVHFTSILSPPTICNYYNINFIIILLYIYTTMIIGHFKFSITHTISLISIYLYFFITYHIYHLFLFYPFFT